MASGEPSGTAPGRFTTKSVRFPERLWKRLGARAKKRVVRRQTLLRELVAEFLRKAA